MNPIQWVIQRNLTKPATLQVLREACEAHQVPFTEIMMIPFSPDLPDFEAAAFNIFYGSTSLMKAVLNHPRFAGQLFFDEAAFRMENYLRHWDSRMLNHEGKVWVLADFMETGVDDRAEWFLRPDGDYKNFAGQTSSTDELKAWYERIQHAGSEEVNPQTRIFAGPVRRIQREWRNFIVNGKVIDSSRYMLNGHLSPSHGDVPAEMIRFSEEAAAHYAPHPVFVLDVAECEDAYFIIECNCFNGTGFYDHRIAEIVGAVSRWCETEYKPES